MPSWLPLFSVFKDLLEDNNLKFTDINRLTDVFTYCNDVDTATSWTDYVVCSSTVDSIHYDFVNSHYKPLFVSFDNITANISLLPYTTPLKSYACKYLVDWCRCDLANVSDYQAELDC